MTETSISIDRVRGADRIASFDIIRGIAILFILFMNIPWMGSYEFGLWDPRHPSWTTADYWATLITKTWLEGTQRGLLELLFGAGIVIMARKAMTPDGPVAIADLHYRRNLWLIVLGLVNAFILFWPGDILLVYGIAAIFLFPFRTLAPRWLFAFAALLMVGLLAANAVKYHEDVTQLAAVEQAKSVEAKGGKLSDAQKEALEKNKESADRRRLLPGDNPRLAEGIARADAARHGSIVAYWKFQAEGWLFLMQRFFWYIEAEIMMTMLIGMALFKLGIIQGKARTRSYSLLLIAGYGVGLTIRGFHQDHQLGFRPGIDPLEYLEDISRLAVTLGHLALIHLALRSSIGRSLLKPFEAAGRMPLTVYLFTSLLMMWVIFAPWGLDWYGRLGNAWLMAIAAVVILGEIAAANLWMRHFHNGPMEWLWKSLSYQRREPMRKARGTAPDAIPSGI